MPRSSPLWLLLVVIASDCSDEERTKLPSFAGGPVLSKAQAGAIVTNYALKQRIDLTKSTPLKGTYDFSTQKWLFLIQPMPPAPVVPGGHFFLIIDKSGNAEYVGGK